MESQRKKKMKNKERLPRTAGLRTLTDLTTDLTKAGIAPSRVQERAVMIAKVRAAGHKRKRDEDGMDIDDDEHDEDGDNCAQKGEEEVEQLWISKEMGPMKPVRLLNGAKPNPAPPSHTFP